MDTKIMRTTIKYNKYKTIIVPYYFFMLILLPNDIKEECWNLFEEYRIFDPLSYAGGLFMHPGMPIEIKNKILQYVSPFTEPEDITLLAIQNKYLPLAYHYRVQDEIYKMGKLCQAFKQYCTIKK